MLEERARANGLTLSEWVRDVLLSASTESGAEAREVALARVASPAVAVPESPLPGGAGSADGAGDARLDRAGAGPRWGFQRTLKRSLWLSRTHESSKVVY
jgi:hypothetical protein